MSTDPRCSILLWRFLRCPHLTLGSILVCLATPAEAQQCVYFANQIRNTVAFVESTDLDEQDPPVGEVALTECAPVFGCQPVSLAFTPDETVLNITNRASNSLAVLESQSNDVTATIPVGGAPSDVEVSLQGVVYVANFASGSVSVVSSTSNTVTDTIQVGVHPSDVAFSPDGDFAYVTNADDRNVSVIDVTSGTVVDSIDVGGNPLSIDHHPTLDRAYVANGADCASRAARHIGS
jgi:YVTN family beta-propeller protein